MTSEPLITIAPIKLRQTLILSHLFGAALEDDFSYLGAAQRRVIRRQNSTRHLAVAIVRPRRHIYAAWQDRELVGYIIAGTEADGSGNIDWLYVRPGTRGNNIGLRLLSRVMQQLHAQGATYITLVTYSYTAYYARQGFRVLRRVESDGVEQDLMRFDF